MQQDSLFSSDSPQHDQTAGPVTCLGKTFVNDQARRDHFLALLAEKLKDPEFRKIEGFPIGSEDDILNLSNPPYYTACPNPWLMDFIEQWESEKDSKNEKQHYHRGPFATDVSEGKNDPIYNAHSYHTKVPYKAIMRYILHYTNPGDIVFDGFCGTGMTGIAAQLCGDKEVVSSLGYQVRDDGIILQEELNEDGNTTWVPFSKLGTRKAVLNDLSPAASFISYNYNYPVDVIAFESEAKRILIEVEEECGWMYKTKHSDGNLYQVDYYVWSEVYSCPACSNEVVFSEVALDTSTGRIEKEISCPFCQSKLDKDKMELLYETKLDSSLGEIHREPKRKIFKIEYKVGKVKYSKKPDDYDLDVINKINSLDVNTFPLVTIPDMQMMRVGRMKSSNATHLHHFFLKRPLHSLSVLWEKVSRVKNPDLKSKLYYYIEQAVWGMSILARYTPTHFSQVNQYLSGVFYMASHIVDVSPQYILSGKLKRLLPVFNKTGNFNFDFIQNTSDSGSIYFHDNSLDYIFIDPPFGENIYYSDLNIIIESLHKVKTNTKAEAIIDRVKGKSSGDYQKLMAKCFNNAYKALKPGRWLTVEFSNSSAGVWNAIQASLSEAGFVVANVSALDKKRGSFMAVTTPTAVKQDLVISAYKPNGGFEERFVSEASGEDGVWDFIRTHLKYLPVTKSQGQTMLSIPERDPRILFDQLVSYYVRKGYQVPMDSKEFQIALMKRFLERDGMFFLSEQVAEYDHKKMMSKVFMQASLFVKDEASAIDWLRQLLNVKPQVFSDINPQFMQQLSGWSKYELPLDLRELLSQNFLCYDGQDEVPEQIHSYLSSNWKELRNLAKNDSALVTKAKDRWYVPDPNKSGDLEKLREKSLLKEFEEYKAAKKKLKVFRIEAVRVGFKKLWEQQGFAALIAVAEKLPNNVLEEDPVLLMYYDQAVTLSQVDADDEW